MGEAPALVLSGMLALRQSVEALAVEVLVLRGGEVTAKDQTIKRALGGQNGG